MGSTFLTSFSFSIFFEREEIQRGLDRLKYSIPAGFENLEKAFQKVGMERPGGSVLTPSSYCSAPAHSSLQSIFISLQANLQIARANSGGEHLPSSSGCLHRAGHPAGSSVCRPQGSPARFWEPTSPCPIPALCGGRSARPSMLVTGQQAPWVLAGYLVTLSPGPALGPLCRRREPRVRTA